MTAARVYCRHRQLLSFELRSDSDLYLMQKVATTVSTGIGASYHWFSQTYTGSLIPDGVLIVYELAPAGLHCRMCALGYRDQYRLKLQNRQRLTRRIKTPPSQSIIYEAVKPGFRVIFYGMGGAATPRRAPVRTMRTASRARDVPSQPQNTAEIWLIPAFQHSAK